MIERVRQSRSSGERAKVLILKGSLREFASLVKKSQDLVYASLLEMRKTDFEARPKSHKQEYRSKTEF